MPTAQAIRLARLYTAQHAGNALTEPQAKLYSQSIRRQMGRDGLVSFGANDIERSLEEAASLIQYAFLTEGDVGTEGSQGVKRAAEMLEWLSQADLRPAGSPLHLLAAAAYQVAGYPAMALGELKLMPDGDSASDILAAFLRADFPACQDGVRRYWQNELAHPTPEAEQFSIVAIQHVIRCVATVTDYLRFGEDDRLQRAVEKLGRLADGFLHSRDPYSALLAQLVAAVAQKYVGASLWRAIGGMREPFGEETAAALQQFGRAQFVNRRALVWPAQTAGIERLREDQSFALCTPTGSGKTTVATLGIIPALFEPNPNLPEGLEALHDNLVLYIVPSRALAAEVEHRLEQDLRGISTNRIVVTGLYGGTDWGPTDAWITQDQPTILICTFEKADALLRFLGVFFLNRVRLVIIDEAHGVNYGKPERAALETASSRPYRLELLGTRLNLAREVYNFRIIALSAVAAEAAPSLARWISRDEEAAPTESRHRSTRQMLGRLEVSTQGVFTIRYDLMNGLSLRFTEGRTRREPWVANPFPQMPQRLGSAAQPDLRMRAPTLWAALNLAAERAGGATPTVLISLTQNPEGFAESCLEILGTWPDETLPKYFDPAANDTYMADCLACVEDYFSTDSHEYRLLQRGIAVHHGKLPSPVARRLKRLIDVGTVRVIIATSTLSEGVNLPVNYILMPSVFRGTVRFELQEFSNLIGRAGRPGVATEGQALVILPEGEERNRQRRGYLELRSELERATNAGEQALDSAGSALAAVLSAIEESWRDLNPNGTAAAFQRWLDQTAVATARDSAAVRNLDSLDYFLLCTLQEVEQLQQLRLEGATLEAELARIWNSTYASASQHEEAALNAIWLRRGRAIPRLYPTQEGRTRIYKTSLTPRSASAMLDRIPAIVELLQTGADYGVWNRERRFDFIVEVVRALGGVPAFQLGEKLGRRQNFTDWPRLLRWWLCKDTLDTQPTPKEITTWFDYVSKNFTYRSAWGLGSVLAIVLNGEDGNPIRPIEMDDWPRAGLPWIAFWLKELLTWGTTEPVASFLLARGDVKTRGEGEQRATDYYDSRPAGLNPNELLDPRVVREWAQVSRVPEAGQRQNISFDQRVVLSRERSAFQHPELHVTPIDVDGRWQWIDKAGHVVARSARRALPIGVAQYEFVLSVQSGTVAARAYLPHR
jgi:superfamily II DNA/RNA helicase